MRALGASSVLSVALSVVKVVGVGGSPAAGDLPLYLVVVAAQLVAAALVCWWASGRFAANRHSAPSPLARVLLVVTGIWLVFGPSLVIGGVAMFLFGRNEPTTNAVLDPVWLSAIAIGYELARVAVAVSFWNVIRRVYGLSLRSAGLPQIRSGDAWKPAMLVLLVYGVSVIVSKIPLAYFLSSQGITPAYPLGTGWPDWVSLLVAGLCAGPAEEFVFAAIPVMVFVALPKVQRSRIRHRGAVRRLQDVGVWNVVAAVAVSGIVRGVGHLYYANDTGNTASIGLLPSAAAVMLWGIAWGGAAVLLMIRYGRILPIVFAHSIANTLSVLTMAPNEYVAFALQCTSLIAAASCALLGSRLDRVARRAFTPTPHTPAQPQYS
ncbi:CPBP family intramembrane metalloprotease [Rhodococcus hoagii]|nr:CPBP family intramembrane metalloprotease [Prescottella equi]